MPRRGPLLRSSTLLLAGLLWAASCTGGEPASGGSAFVTSTPAPEQSPPATPFIAPAEGPPPSPTPPAIPERPPETAGPASRTCVKGWITPPEGTPLFTEPIGVIRRTSRFTGDYVVVDMRYFIGPESPPSDTKGYLQDIERWYVKLFAPEDPGYQGRFLVEARRFGRGLSAVAPYDTRGFSSPDWVGFQWDAADTSPKRYDGLPGKWRGVPYDFVKGGAGLTIPGLPDEVVGCMDGT